jgi:hypothetical protein
VALDVTPVNRNLQTRATFLALEFEDMFAVLGLAALMNLVSRFAAGTAAALLQYGVPLATIPLLMIFKYGKPRAYLRDLFRWYTRPRAYSAAARDGQMRTPYLMDEEESPCR